MNINIDSLTCGKCGHRIDVEWYTHDPFDKEYWDAVKAAMDGKFKPWSNQKGLLWLKSSMIL